MKKITILLIVSVSLLFAASESFYKNKYEYYTKKVKDIKEKQWSYYLEAQQLSDYKREFQQLGAIGEARKTEKEIEEVEAKSDDLDQKVDDYKDKLMELKFTLEEELGKVPKWYKE
jgi:predicted  nucleic acid-binding Zn-ribbon protein